MKKFLFFLVCSIGSLATSAETHFINSEKPWLIIFLDIDGVLFNQSLMGNLRKKQREKVEELFDSSKEYDQFKYEVASGHLLDKNAVNLLEDFVDQLAASYQIGIVLSSDWRLGKTIEYLRNQIFASWRFSRVLIDKTVDNDAYYSDQEDHPSALSMRKYGFSLNTRGDQIDYWLKEHMDMNIAGFLIFDDIDDGLSKKFPANFVYVQDQLLSRIDILEAQEHLTPREASQVYEDTSENREVVTKKLALHYAQFLPPSFSKSQVISFVNHLQKEIQKELNQRAFVRLNPSYHGILAKTFRNMGLIPQMELFPPNSISYIARNHGNLSIVIN